MIKVTSSFLRTFWMAVFCFLRFWSAQAQSIPYPFQLPENIPVPLWVKQTDWQSPNVWVIDSLIANEQSFKKHKEEDEEDEEMKANRSGYLSHEEEYEEEPYRTAYRRWRMQMTPFIQNDGSIKYDPGFYKIQMQKALEEQNPEEKSKGKMYKTTATANWKALGPVKNFYEGGDTSANHTNVYLIAIAPSNPNILYIGTETGVLFKSTNKGVNWSSISESLPPMILGALVVDPADANTVYCYSDHNMIKTTSGGTSWTSLSSYTGGYCQKMVINPSTGRILAAEEQNVYYSDNGGTSWSIATGSAITGQFFDIEFIANSKDTLFALGSDSLRNIVMLRSINGGTSFATITSGLSGIRNNGGRLAVSPANPSFVYCIVLDYKAFPKLLKSTDFGTNWFVVAASTTSKGTGGSGTIGLEMSNGQGFYDLDIMVNPGNANHVIVGTTTAYKSTDGGVNFAPFGGYIGTFDLHPDMQCMRAMGGDAYITSDGSVNYSSDFFSNKVNHSIRNNGITGVDYWGFGQGWDEDIVVGGTYHNGDNAQFQDYGKGNSVYLGGAESATGHVFHGKERTVGFNDIGSYVIPKVLSGFKKTAPQQNSQWPLSIYYGEFNGKLMVDPRYSNTYYLSQDSVLWRSMNSGLSYVALHNFGYGNEAWRFDIARSNPDYIYLCARNGVYKSIDGGINWTKLTIPYSGYNYYNTDIAVDPENERNVYFSMANGSASEKVFKSTNGGTTWTNITGATLFDKKVIYIQFQAGANGAVYACVRENSTIRIYFRDNSMGDWISYSDGLPDNMMFNVGMLLFYRDSKIRISGSRGVWESPLYSKGSPVAQPMADRRITNCARDTINFFDYSILDYEGATWTWTFPGASYVSSTTVRKPKVLYPSPGKYSVSLKVTDKLGRSHTKTVTDMIEFSTDNCAADTVAGKCLDTKDNIKELSIGTVNLNSNTFSISCWIKPNGNQKYLSQILSHYGCPGSTGHGFGLGFTLSGYTPNLKLCYTDDIVNHSNTSSLYCDSTQWNYVVLTYSPTGVRIYLNGIGEDVHSGPMPALDFSQEPFFLNADIHHRGTYVNAQIDEVKFYNYTLNQNEVREKMHLIQKNGRFETGLIKYIQFNRYDPITETLYDIVQGNKIDIPSTNIITSTAPVATGNFSRLTNVNKGGLHHFANADIKLYLPGTGTYPNGEMVGFHLYSGPDQNPDKRATTPEYFIVNNYGVNKLFTQPDSIRLSNLKINTPWYKAGNFKLFKRGSTMFGATWGSEIDSAKSIWYKKDSSSLLWGANSKLTSLGQMVIVNHKVIPLSIANPILQTETAEISEIYPNPTSDWAKLDVYTKTQRQISIRVLDIYGVSVCSMVDVVMDGKNTLMIKLPPLARGNYIVTIRLQGEMQVNRKLTIY